MDKNKVIKDYTESRPLYKALSAKVASIVREVLEINHLNYVFVHHRAKEIDSFSVKINDPKYDKPLDQITDLAGIRICTYVEDDVHIIAELISEYFIVDKDNSLDKGKSLGIDKVGYKSVHFICKLPENRIGLPEYERYEGLKFEIQVRSILQHSWAEIEHDRNYKFSGTLPDEIQRRFNLLAGTLELVDREFNKLSKEIDDYSKNVRDKASSGDVKDIPINSTSLLNYIPIKFESLVNTSYFDIQKAAGIVEELELFGIKTLSELDSVIPDDLQDRVLDEREIYSLIGLIRTVMLIHDPKKYFKKVKPKWKNISSKVIDLLDLYGLSEDEFKILAPNVEIN